MLLTALVLLTTLVGCGSPVGPVAGDVQFDDGSPVQSGSIEFRNVKSGDRYAGKIDSQGRFVPRNQEGEAGLPPGDYEVVVVQIVLTEDLAAEHHRHGRTVPRRYADYHTSDLSYSVESGPTNDLTIVLSAD